MKKKLLLIFIIIQPILDLITSFQSTYFNFPISLSILIRGLSLVIITIYLLFDKNKKIKIYIISFIIYCLIFLSSMYFINGSEHIFSELYTIIRFFYFPILLVFFYKIYKEYKEEIFNDKLLIYITCFYFIIAFVAFITKTSFLSYDDIDKIGFNGWFYSSNERGGTYALLLPLLLPLINRNKKYIILFLLGAFSMIILGTKVGLLGLLLTLISGIVYFTIKKSKVMLIFMIIILLIVGINYKRLPVYNNILNQGENVDEIINSKENMTKEEIEEAIKADDNYLIEDKTANLIYSRREVFLEQNLDYFNSQNIYNKLIGVGISNKKIDNVLIVEKVERDFFDVFFTFGYVGFIIYFLPIVYMLFYIAINIIKNIKTLFEINTWFLLTSIATGFLIAFMSGHILLAPSVSIYLLLIVNNLYLKIMQ